MDFQEHLCPGPTCVLAFASGAGRFEWGGFLGRLGVPHVLFRDTTDHWYLRGVIGLGDRYEVVVYIRRLILERKRVVTLGLSSGSYAALLYGHLARAAEAIAISPITGKGTAVFDDFEPQWRHRIEHGPEHPEVLDLKPLFKLWQLPVRAFVSDGAGTELDRGMAERLGPGVEITRVPGYSHAGLAKALCIDGTLARLLGENR